MNNFSILIPHYQKRDALRKTWEELHLQLHPDDEVLIIDDWSPDGVPNFDCKCTTIIRPKKRTPHIYRLNTLRNFGLKNAKWDNCIILDPDCIPNPNFIDNARKICDPNVLHGGCIDKVQEDGSTKYDGRRSDGKSYWVDLLDKRGGGIWGGCMMFSKSRAYLIGWFDEEYDGAWGAEDADFAARCYHSGMRLRFSMGLSVIHQYHPKNEEGYTRNRKTWISKTDTYRTHLSVATPYHPAVGVMVITMLRPELINQCLQAIFRNRIPLKVRLVNNGDSGEETRRICESWGRRWAVDYVHHERKWPAAVRNESLQWAKNNGFKYLVMIDDDVLVVNNGINKLILTMETNPDVYAMSGKLRFVGKPSYLLGGPLRDRMFYHYTDRVGLYASDWVGGGFTIHRVNPLLPYDDEYETGFNDYDWSMKAKEKGYKLAVTGDAEAWHGARLTSSGFIQNKNRDEYNKIRYDSERHTRMRKRFESKWGFWLEGGGAYSG